MLAFEKFRVLGDDRGVAVASRWLAVGFRRQGRLAECCAAAERALMHAEAAGERDARREAGEVLGYALCDGPTPVGDAICRCEELLQANRNDRFLEATITPFLSALHAMAGRFEEANRQARRSEHALDELNYRGSLRYRTAMAEARELAGDRAGAEQELSAMWQRYRDMRAFSPDVLAMRAAYQLALLYCDEGRWEDAARCLDYGRDVPVPNYFRHEAVLGLAARGRLAAHRGALAEALTLAQRAVELAERTDMLNLRGRAWLALAEAQQRNGDGTRADAAVATAIRLYEKKGNVAAAAPLRSEARPVAG